MKNNKKTVIYARTAASNKQSLDLQLEAAKPFVKGVQEENVVIITETASSGLTQQVGLQKILELVKNDQLETLIVYQRDRLARNLIDYSEIAKLIYAHKVKVIFTASGELPFDSEQGSGVLKEIIYSQHREKERNMMSNRIKAALKAKQS